MCADHVKPSSLMRDASSLEKTSKIESSGKRTYKDEEGYIIPYTSSISNQKTFSEIQKDKVMKVRLVELTENSYFPRDLNEYNHSTDICIMEQELSPEHTATIKANNKENDVKLSKRKIKKLTKIAGCNQNINQRIGNGDVKQIDPSLRKNNLHKQNNKSINSHGLSINNNSNKPKESNYYNLYNPVQPNFYVINPSLQPTLATNVHFQLGDPLYSQMAIGKAYQTQIKMNSNPYLFNNSIIRPSSPFYYNHGSQLPTQINPRGITQPIIPQSYLNLQDYYNNTHLLNPSNILLPNNMRPSSSLTSRFVNSEPKSSNK